MVFPIVGYGAAVLRKKAKDISSDYPNLSKMIEDMWETVQASSGVGLAAPQINKDIRLFIVDSKAIFDNLDKEDEGRYSDAPGIRRVFINANILEYKDAEWAYNEGCLSIPKIREDVYRPKTIVMEYLDENFEPHTETFTGITARVIQHEYDHIEGKLFIDYLKPLKKKLLQGKLNDIAKGKIRVDYKMIFVK